MTRRASLPGADELFRRTAGPLPATEEVFSGPASRIQEVIEMAERRPLAAATAAAHASGALAAPQASKPRHDEKVTFYCTADELTRLETARLTLRVDHKISSDRGRIVRAALAEMLEDFEARGSQSALVRRLKSEG